MRPFHDRAHGHGEWLAAVLALVQTRPRALASHQRNPIAHDPAERTGWAVRPQQRFKVLACPGIIVKDRIADIELASHGLNPLSEGLTTSGSVVCQPDNSPRN